MAKKPTYGEWDKRLRSFSKENTAYMKRGTNKCR